MLIFIGIDYSAEAVKAVAIKRADRGGFVIVNTHFFPIPLDEKSEKQELLKITHLKTLYDLYKKQDVKYIVCFPQNEVSTRRVYFPFNQRYKISKSLLFEMEDKTLFDCTQLVADFQILSSTPQKTQVMAFVVFKEQLKNALHQLKSVGINPFIFTCESSAICNLFIPKSDEQSVKNKEHLTSSDKKKASFFSKARLINLFSSKKTKDISPKNVVVEEHNHQQSPSSKVVPHQTSMCDLYIKIDYHHTTIWVLKNSQLRDVYHFEWGAFACIKKIATKYEISLSSAMEQFLEKAFVLTSKRGYTGSQIAFSAVLQEELDFLIHKVQLLLLEMDSEQGEQCSKIIICGAGSHIRNLQAFLSSRWNYPVVRAEKPINAPQWNLRNNDDKQNNLMTALGTAMEGLKGVRLPPINFLKGEFAVKWHWMDLWSPKRRQKVVMVAIGSMVFFVYAYLRHQQSEHLLSKTENLFQQRAIRVAHLRPKQVSVSKVKHFINSKQHLIKNVKLAEVLLDRPSALDSMKALSIVIRKQPEWRLEITKLDIADRFIQLQGVILKPYLKYLEKNLNTIALKGTFKTLSVTPLSLDSKNKQSDKNTDKTTHNTDNKQKGKVVAGKVAVKKNKKPVIKSKVATKNAHNMATKNTKSATAVVQVFFAYSFIRNVE